MCSTDDDLEQLAHMTQAERVYASMWERGTKQRKEFLVVTDFFASMARLGEEQYSKPHIGKHHPPDVIAFNRSGQLVAFEVTELVSQEAIEWNERFKRRAKRRPGLDEMVFG